jgi:hypothetical protein
MICCVFLKELAIFLCDYNFLGHNDQFAVPLMILLEIFKNPDPDPDPDIDFFKF